jgi:HJR/Mrr/RecB family endonuclease
VIFVRWHALQTILQGRIRAEFGLLPPVVNGVTPPRRRKYVIDEFSRSDGFGVLILGPRAAGLGLNITSANHVIHYTREWNPAVEAQCTDRVYRIGQERPVFVHYPIVSEVAFKTVEQRLDELLQEKTAMAGAVLRPTDELAARPDDFADCLGGIPAAPSATLSVDDVDQLDWRQFEALVAAMMASQGYEAELTSDRDAGADIIARSHARHPDTLIQVKHRTPGAGAAGPEGVYQVVASRAYYEGLTGRSFPRLMVVTNTGFTRQARSVADANSVVLLERRELSALLADHEVGLAQAARFLR